MTCMPKFNVIIWNAYNVIKFLLYTRLKGDRSIVQKNGVMVDVESMYFSNSKNKNLIMASRSYFGVIENI